MHRSFVGASAQRTTPPPQDDNGAILFPIQAGEGILRRGEARIEFEGLLVGSARLLQASSLLQKLAQSQEMVGRRRFRSVAEGFSELDIGESFSGAGFVGINLQSLFIAGAG